jgi:hypothetical protein
MYSNFLLGYQNILSMASSQLHYLREEIFEFFRLPSSLRRSVRDPCGDLNAALVLISGIANDLARNQIALSSQNELRAALSNQISVGSVLLRSPTRLNTCQLCEKEWQKAGEGEGEKICEKSKEHPWGSNSSMVEDTIKDFKQTGAICQEVLVRQAQVSEMIRCAWWDGHVAQIQDYSAQIYLRILSINARAISIMREAKDSRISTHQANRFCLLLGQDENNTARDLLGRSVGHQLMDQLPYQRARYIVPKDFQFLEVESLNQVQDRLGRTLLHLLCQKGSYECVEMGLQTGADPSATTIYGHLPMHYAAQRGDDHICLLLLKYKTEFDVRQKDDFGHTACLYAATEGHWRVVSLLKAAVREQRTSRTLNEE